MTLRTAFLFVATSLVAACDPVGVVEGEAVVPPSVQAQFSKDNPGLLVVQSYNETSGVYLLCDPQQTPLKVKFSFGDMPCFKEGPINAWIEAAAPGTCGETVKDFHQPAPAEKRLATGEAIAFKGKGCSGGTSKPRIDLAAKAQP
jgi:hypothetical protein